MSLAATTNTSLTLIEAPNLKFSATSSDTKVFSIPAPPTASVWASDNSTLYIASSHEIQAFSPASGKLTSVYTSPPDAPLGPALAVRDASTVLFTQDKTIHILAISSRTPKIVNSLPPHAAPVVSMAFSNDGTLLASASAAGVLHVYNLTHNSNTVLRGFPGASRAQCLCMFDLYVRTRLFVGAGTTLAVYDTSRTGGPVKTIALAEKGATVDIGNVVAISPSPYSKTLVVVACTAFVGLVDLDKEKPLFKTLSVKAPVTSMAFTVDGTAIAMGTESGKVIVHDLRNSERQRVFDVGKGNRIITLSIQKRVKGSPSASSLTVPRISTSQSAPLATHDLNSAKSPARRTVSSKTPVTPKGRVGKLDPPKRAFSPPRAPVRGGNEDVGDISVQLETLIGGGVKTDGSKKMKKQEQDVALSDLKVRPRASASRADASAAARSVRPSERPSSRLTADARSASRKSSLAPSDASAPSDAPLAGVRTRTLSQSGESQSAKLPTLTLLSAPAPSRRTSTTSTARTETPDLPSVDEAESPLWTSRRGLHAPQNPEGMLTTPDMDRWIEAGRGPKAGVEKRVGWVDEDEDDDSEKENAAPGAGDDDELTISTPKDKGKAPAAGPVPGSSTPSMDLSPVRRPHLPSSALQLSPLRSSPLRGNAAGGSNGGAQELLRAVVKDVMYEYRQETREDIKGLHLDLLKMGRSWKSELRSMMDEYVGDLRDLREENLRLRSENDRLRRGY